MQPIVVAVRTQLPASAERAFDVIAAIDLSTIMRGRGILPPVAGVEDQSGAWDSVGESRIVRLADDTGWIETLTAVDRPRRFAYSSVGLTSWLRWLVGTIRGEWTFAESVLGDRPSVVEIRWYNELVGRSWWTRPLLAIVANWIWRPQMERAIELAAEEVIARGR